MQERLVGLIGEDAYKMHIHTFHGFGAWMMRAYPEYFRYYFDYKPADDVARYQVYASIFERLAHGHVLASVNDGDYIYLKDVQTRISQLKQAGVDPEQLRSLCKIDSEWLKDCNQFLETELAGLKTVNVKSLALFEKLLSDLPVAPKSALGTRFRLELSEALNAANMGNKPSTKPITAWKNAWLTKSGEGVFIAKATRDCEKLLALADIYEKYQKAMKKNKLVDYDDLLMTTLQVLRSNTNLLAELQEKFLYIMVDEYQDTSGIQQQILDIIADNPIHENQPNLMVVGDDDQAIYGFQGAYSSNVLDFLKRWKDVRTVTLIENYRSTPKIVSFARSVILQSEDRLETNYESINKELFTKNADGPDVRLVESATESGSLAYIAQEIKKRIKAGQDPENIAVLGPKHAHLEAIVPHLDALGIATRYERRQDVLEETHIRELCLLAEVIDRLSMQDLRGASERLPELLSLPWWGIDPIALWHVSLQASKKHLNWLEVIQESSDKKLQAVATWLIEQSVAVRHTPLEIMLDKLIGGDQKESFFDSPYRRYYFDEQKDPGTYLYLLTSLIAIRIHLRNYAGDKELLLSDFVSYVSLSKAAGLRIANDHPVTTGEYAVQLMTAHGSKGLEFKTVYLLKAEQSGWANSRGRRNLINMPPHIAAVPAGDSDDERLRLFYVALTRSEHELTLVTSKASDDGKETLPLGWLADERTHKELAREENNIQSPEVTLRTVQFEWYARHIDSKLQASWRETLHESMQSYRLSPTHFNAFLDVSRGGPKTFLLNQLLRFPHALGPSASFGNAMHHTMEYLHNQYNENDTLPTKNSSEEYFATDLAGYHLGGIETPKQTARGLQAIAHIYKNASDIFGSDQTAEKDFAYEDVMLGDIRLKGKIDVLQIDKKAKTALVTDYKTGKPSSVWPKPTGSDYETLKLHRYRQQLLFYKLLIDGSREYGGKISAFQGQLIFLERGDSDQLLRLSVDYERNEIERLKTLIKVVWNKIINLDLPDTSNYSPDANGVRQFEDDLLDGSR
jgi:DNA helicase-2/ATP-dependent DNA helicase PcrA